MKVIFLDFDGVLNSEKYLRTCEQDGIAIDMSRLQLLKMVVEATNAKIILSTSWREHWETDGNCDAIGQEINRIFAQFGLQIFGKTQHLGGSREREVEQWLATHPQTTNFVVIDDRFMDSEIIRGHFVKTANYRDGFDQQNVKQAIAILNR